jgi:hypothetical protein
VPRDADPSFARRPPRLRQDGSSTAHEIDAARALDGRCRELVSANAGSFEDEETLRRLIVSNAANEPHSLAAPRLRTACTGFVSLNRLNCSRIFASTRDLSLAVAAPREAPRRCEKNKYLPSGVTIGQKSVCSVFDGAEVRRLAHASSATLNGRVLGM